MDTDSDLVDLIIHFQSNPVDFVEQLMGAKPQKWQANFLNAVAQNDKIAVRSGHGVGKTTVLAWLILWFLLTQKPVKLAVTAPTASQIDGALWSELRTWHLKLPDAFKNMLEITSDKIYLKESPSENVCYARTASKERPEALQGLHSKNMVFIIDEASGVDEIVFETAAGSLSTEGAKVIMTGNPTRTTGYFFDAFYVWPERWHLMKVSCYESELVGHTYIEDQKARYGEQSNTFRVRVLGEFPEASDDVLMLRSVLSAAIDRDVAPTLYAPIVWGLDVARFGNDRTALCKRQGNTLLDKIQVKDNLDTMQISGWVYNEYDKTPPPLRPSCIYVDVIGLGAGVVDRLDELGLPVIGINVSERPSNKGRFMRLRDELWFKAKEWFEARDCKIPDDATLINELCIPTYSFNSNGQITVESKNDIKKRGHRSPDLADAFCLTLLDTSFSLHNKLTTDDINRKYDILATDWAI